MMKDFANDYGAVALVITTSATVFLWSAVETTFPFLG